MINIIVNISRIDNNIDHVRSCIDVLTEILTVFRKTGNHFIINTRCIDYKCQLKQSAEQNGQLSIRRILTMLLIVCGQLLAAFSAMKCL